MTNEVPPWKRRMVLELRVSRAQSPEPQQGNPANAKRTLFKRQRMTEQLYIQIRKACLAALAFGGEIEPAALMEAYGLTKHNANSALYRMRQEARLLPAAHKNGNHLA